MNYHRLPIDFSIGPVPSTAIISSSTIVSSKAIREACERKAKKLHFYQNGRPYDSKLTVSIIPGKEFTNLEQLYEFLTKKTCLLNGVHYIFTYNGRLIRSLDELEHDQTYVISSSKNFVPFAYGSSNPSQRLTTGIPTNVHRNKFAREDDLRLLRPLSSKFNNVYAVNHHYHKLNPNVNNNCYIEKPQQTTVIYTPTREIRTVTIVNNKNHDLHSKVILNLKTPKSFDLLLIDLGEAVQLKCPRVMFTSNGQMVRINSQIDLF